MFLVFQAITSVQRDTGVVKIQSAKTGTQKLLANARMVTSLSKGTLHIVKVNKIFKDPFPEQLTQKHNMK